MSLGVGGRYSAALAPHGQGRPRPWTPAGGGSAPRPLRSCGAEVGSGRSVGLSQDAKGARGASLRAANSSALETSLRLVSKRLLGYDGLWRGKEVGSSRGERGTAASPGGGGGAKRPQRRGQGPWPLAAPLVGGAALRPAPPTPPPPRGGSNSPPPNSLSGIPTLPYPGGSSHAGCIRLRFFAAARWGKGGPGGLGKALRPCGAAACRCVGKRGEEYLLRLDSLAFSR